MGDNGWLIFICLGGHPMRIPLYFHYQAVQILEASRLLLTILTFIFSIAMRRTPVTRWIIEQADTLQHNGMIALERTCLMYPSKQSHANYRQSHCM